MAVATGTLETVDVVRLLGTFIAANELGPGDRLPPIRELAVKFGVKPGAVRDGLLTAQASGLVKVLPRVGAIVQPDGEASVSGDAVANSSGNAVMTSLLRILLLEVRPHLDRIRWSGNRRAETNESHARIYSVLVAGDVEQAQSEMRDHIRATYDSLLDEMREPPTMNGGA